MSIHGSLIPSNRQILSAFLIRIEIQNGAFSRIWQFHRDGKFFKLVIGEFIAEPRDGTDGFVDFLAVDCHGRVERSVGEGQLPASQATGFDRHDAVWDDNRHVFGGYSVAAMSYRGEPNWETFIEDVRTRIDVMNEDPGAAVLGLQDT